MPGLSKVVTWEVLDGDGAVNSSKDRFVTRAEWRHSRFDQLTFGF